MNHLSKKNQQKHLNKEEPSPEQNYAKVSHPQKSPHSSLSEGGVCDDGNVYEGIYYPGLTDCIRISFMVLLHLVLCDHGSSQKDKKKREKSRKCLQILKLVLIK